VKVIFVTSTSGQQTILSAKCSPHLRVHCIYILYIRVYRWRHLCLLLSAYGEVSFAMVMKYQQKAFFRHKNSCCSTYWFVMIFLHGTEDDEKLLIYVWFGLLYLESWPRSHEDPGRLPGTPSAVLRDPPRGAGPPQAHCSQILQSSKHTKPKQDYCVCKINSAGTC